MDTSKGSIVFAVVVSVVVGGASYGLRWRVPAPAELPVQFDRLPLEFGGLRGTETRFSQDTYDVLRADTTTYRRYVDSTGHPVWLFAAYFAAQNYGEQIHSPRNCLPGGGWNILMLDRLPLHIPERGELIVNRLLIEAQGVRQVMYYFFLTRVGSVASEYRLKLDLARAALTFRPRDALFVRVSAPVGEGDAEAADRLCLRFLTSGFPLLSRGLPF